jgi:hypothetical protein
LSKPNYYYRKYKYLVGDDRLLSKVKHINIFREFNTFVISKEFSKLNEFNEWKPTKRYMIVDNAIDIFDKIMYDEYNNENSYQKYCKYFHEVIIDSKIVKLYMNFDFSFSSECYYNIFNEQEFFNYIFDGLDKQFKYYGIKLKFSYDIMVITSHKNKIKHLYHIVVCRYDLNQRIMFNI